MDGLFGAIIVYDKYEPTGEIPIVLFDHYHVNSIELEATNRYNFPIYLGTSNYQCRQSKKSYQHGIQVSGDIQVYKLYGTPYWGIPI